MEVVPFGAWTVLCLAYPLPPHLAEKLCRPTLTPERFRSTESLLRNIVVRWVYAGGIGFLNYIIAINLVNWLRDEFKAIDNFIEFWSDLISRPLSGEKSIRAKVGSPELGSLPPEVFGEIGKRLESRHDIVSFRSVCTEWHTYLPCPTRFPLPVPPLPNCDAEFRNRAYFITEVSIYLRKRARYTVVGMEELDRQGKFRIYHSNPWITKRQFPKILDMASLNRQLSKLSFVTKVYQFRKRFQGQWDWEENTNDNKIVLISSNDGVNPSYARASDVSAVALLSSGRLALLRLLGSPQSWRWDTDFCSQVFKGIGTYKGHLCTIDQWGRVFFMDYHSLQMTQVGPTVPFSPEQLLEWTMRRKHLFELRGELYVSDAVFDQYNIILAVEAYKLSLQHNKWIRSTESFCTYCRIAAYYV